MTVDEYPSYGTGSRYSFHAELQFTIRFAPWCERICGREMAKAMSKQQ